MEAQAAPVAPLSQGTEGTFTISPRRRALAVLLLVAVVAFVVGFLWSFGSSAAQAAEPRREAKQPAQIRYPDRTELDFEGLQIEGEIRNPGEFYFQHRQEEKFDSLVKRRKNFHRELLRDAVLSR